MIEKQSKYLELYETMECFGIESDLLNKAYTDGESLEKLYHMVLRTRDFLITFLLEKILISTDPVKFDIFLNEIERKYGYTLIDCFYDPLILIKECNRAYGIESAMRIMDALKEELKTYEHMHLFKRFSYNLEKYFMQKTKLQINNDFSNIANQYT